MSRVAVRRVAVVTALVVGAGVLVSAGLGSTASRGSRAEKAAPFSPSKLDAVRLKVGLRVTPRATARGKTVTYLMRVSNVGADPALLLRVCDTVPQGLTLVSAPPHFVLRRGSVCRTFTSLPVGGTGIINFRMKVSSSASAGVVVNTASARARGMSRALFARASLRIFAPCPGGRSFARLLC